MPNAPRGSTVPRRRLGRELEAWRTKLGWSRKTAAAKLEISDTKLWRLENGRVASQPIMIRLICHIYGIDDHLTEALVALAKLTREKGWWHSYGDVIPEWFDVFVGLEAAASELLQYEPALVPGILQSLGYAEEVYRGPGSVATTDDEIARRVEVRLRRKDALTRDEDPLHMKAYLSEAALRTPVGGPAVMVEQLEHLVKLGELPNVTVHVLPFSAGFHAGLMFGSTHILRFPEDHDPDTVFIQEPSGGLYLDEPQESQQYQALFDDVARHALDAEASRDLLIRTAREYQR
jgi:transcriptional regulator with XRE-family HTH domain